MIMTHCYPFKIFFIVSLAEEVFLALLLLGRGGGGGGGGPGAGTFACIIVDIEILLKFSQSLSDTSTESAQFKTLKLSFI